MKNRHLLLLIAVLLVILILLIGQAVRLSKGGAAETVPSGTTSQPTDGTTAGTTTAGTTPPATTAPPETTAPSSLGEKDIYTRAELEALSTEKFGYGPGKASDGNRAPYAEAEQQKYSQYGANFIAPDNGKIYLTFDCGYEYTATNADGSTYRVTEKILDVLKEKNVKGVFFITKQYARTQPDLVQRMIDEGHIVGNHSTSHPVMPDQTIDEMIDEVMTLHEYVLEQFGYEMFLFRPPTGAFSVQSLAVVQNLGYKNVHWSFAYADYDTDNQPDVAEALERVTSSAHSGAIYLLHAVSTTNAALLADAIDYFRAQGYEIDLFR